jgi:hypothetical protein
MNKVVSSPATNEEVESTTTPPPSADDKDVSANEDKLVGTTIASPPLSQISTAPILPIPKPRTKPTQGIFMKNKRKPANALIVARAS